MVMCKIHFLKLILISNCVYQSASVYDVNSKNIIVGSSLPRVRLTVYTSESDRSRAITRVQFTPRAINRVQFTPRAITRVQFPPERGTDIYYQSSIYTRKRDRDILSEFNFHQRERGTEGYYQSFISTRKTDRMELPEFSLHQRERRTDGYYQSSVYTREREGWRAITRVLSTP